MELLRAVDAPARAVVVVAHGLNQRAHALLPLCEALRRRGATIVLVRFHGHLLDAEHSPETIEEWRSLDWRQWLRDWEEASAAAASIAARDHLPLTFLGFSLGALVHAHAMACRDEAPPPFAAQLLLAPAIRLRPRSRAVLLFRALGRRFLVPSLAPAAVRSHGATSVAAYEALFHLVSSLDAPRHPERLRLPTLVLIDPGDELSSPERLRRWIAHNGLASHWQVRGVPRDGPIGTHRFRHYVTDETALGVASFARLVEMAAAALLMQRSVHVAPPDG
jgi:hypothetical protein